ncbi:hypothetical protein B0H14DRAFT_2555804 [Mycena olivaceomarginata]|nr:hypothetical protein B0H14DRAFT_2555804 [Mycena olivaceomarginata]
MPGWLFSARILCTPCPWPLKKRMIPIFSLHAQPLFKGVWTWFAKPTLKGSALGGAIIGMTELERTMRLPKIRRANASRMPEYKLQRAALNWTPSPKWEVTDTEANRGEDTWGTGEWGPTDPAWQDPGFWLTPKGDDISPILLIRPLPSY